MNKQLDLPVLSEAALARITGGGGELDFRITTPPVKGAISLTYTGAKASASGAFTLDGKTWGVGFSAGYQPTPKINLQAYVKVDPFQREVGISGSIRFLHA